MAEEKERLKVKEVEIGGCLIIQHRKKMTYDIESRVREKICMW